MHGPAMKHRATSHNASQVDSHRPGSAGSKHVLGKALRHDGESAGRGIASSALVLAMDTAATVGPLIGLGFFLRGARRMDGFRPMNNTLSQTMQEGMSFSLGTFACGLSTLLLAHRLRSDESVKSSVDVAAIRGLEATGYVISMIGLTKWGFMKRAHIGIAGTYFLGSPIAVSAFGIDAATRGLKIEGSEAIVAAAVAGAAFAVGYDARKQVIPAAFEFSHAAALSLLEVTIAIERLWIPRLKKLGKVGA